LANVPAKTLEELSPSTQEIKAVMQLKLIMAITTVPNMVIIKLIKQRGHSLMTLVVPVNEVVVETMLLLTSDPLLLLEKDVSTKLSW
jgi:hypothetical protein